MNQPEQDKQPQAPGWEDGRVPKPPSLSPRKALIGMIILGLIFVVVAIAGIVPRVRARAKLRDMADAEAAPDVLAIPPRMGKPNTEIVLPGNMYAYTDSPIYARTSGYLEKWYFDIGAHVRKGQLLAVISSPEVDQQLLQARADLATAQASAGLAQTNATRYQGLLTQNAVSKQDTDTFITQQASTSSAVKSAQANMQRLQELQSFEKIYAPFDGVVTARNVDIGTTHRRWGWRDRDADVPHGCYPGPARVHQCSANLLTGRSTRIADGDHPRAIPRRKLSRQDRAHGQLHRSQLAYPPGRGRCE